MKGLAFVSYVRDFGFNKSKVSDVLKKRTCEFLQYIILVS